MAVASVGAFNKYADCWTLLTLVVRLTRHFNTKLKSLILDWIWSFPSRELIHFEVLTWDESFTALYLLPIITQKSQMSRKTLPYHKLFHTIYWM